MGLDIYIMKMKQISDDEIREIDRKHEREIENHFVNRSYIQIQEENLHDELYHDLQPFLKRITMTRTLMDLDAIKNANHIPEEWKCRPNFQSSSQIGMTFYNDLDDKQNKSVTLEIQEIEDSFSYDSNEHMYLCETDHIPASDLRNDYDFDEIMHDLYLNDTGRCILNCGYYRMTPDMITETNKKLIPSPKLNENDTNIFYKIWF